MAAVDQATQQAAAGSRRPFGLFAEAVLPQALLIGLVLAHAGLLTAMSGWAPVLLLDEVVAHLDPARRTALYRELEMLGAQVWITGADAAAFAEIERHAQFFMVSPGRIAPR